MGSDESGVAGAVTVRAMKRGDVDGVMTIAAGLSSAPGWPRTAYEAALQSKEMQETALARVALAAEAGDELAGFAIAACVDGQAEIESIAVSSGAQRRGIATALLEALIAELKAAGAKRVQLEVRESNMAARGLYARAGFREAGRRRRYYRAPDEDALMLALDLI